MMQYFNDSNNMLVQTSIQQPLFFLLYYISFSYLYLHPFHLILIHVLLLPTTPWSYLSTFLFSPLLPGLGLHGKGADQVPVFSLSCSLPPDVSPTARQTSGPLLMTLQPGTPSLGAQTYQFALHYIAHLLETQYRRNAPRLDGRRSCNCGTPGDVISPLASVPIGGAGTGVFSDPTVTP